jgi:hypothetical protein
MSYYRFFAWFYAIGFWILFVAINIVANQRDEALAMARPTITTENGVVTVQCTPGESK